MVWSAICSQFCQSLKPNFEISFEEEGRLCGLFFMYRMYGTPQMQEQFVAMYRMYGTVNQGFQDAKLLASCLINALSSAKSNNAGTWCPELVGGQSSMALSNFFLSYSLTIFVQEFAIVILTGDTGLLLYPSYIILTICGIALALGSLNVIVT
ncbi:hypothetical protein [Rheinheimera texasensis]|uniref:hypothetical protein n=1 Tax=Rheinheimera texasensis TaxID=306205 RepID=UPI0012FF2EAF|nr:hypothetical protein [Rheinheimera texasensis]